MHGTSHCNLHNHFPQCPRGRLPWGRNVELRFEKKRLLPPGASPLGTVASGLSLKFGSPFGLRTCSAPAACLPAFLPDFPPAPPSPVGVQARGLAQRMRTAGVRPTGVVRGCLGRKRTISVGKKKKKTQRQLILGIIFSWPFYSSGPENLWWKQFLAFPRQRPPLPTKNSNQPAKVARKMYRT